MSSLSEEIQQILQANPKEAKLGSVHVGGIDPWADGLCTGVMLAMELALALQHPNYEIEIVREGEYITFYASPHSQSS